MLPNIYFPVMTYFLAIVLKKYVDVTEYIYIYIYKSLYFFLSNNLSFYIFDVVVFQFSELIKDDKCGLLS